MGSFPSANSGGDPTWPLRDGFDSVRINPPVNRKTETLRKVDALREADGALLRASFISSQENRCRFVLRVRARSRKIIQATRSSVSRSVFVIASSHVRIVSGKVKPRARSDGPTGATHSNAATRLPCHRNRSDTTQVERQVSDKNGV